VAIQPTNGTLKTECIIESKKESKKENKKEREKEK
jgi:hypothetical protein